MEYTAEDLIAHKLQRANILVAKPKFDQDGADLLALLHVKDNAKFCRIQCKGRSLGKYGASVEIPTKYVSDGFVLFLFVETGDPESTPLFCFLGREIRANWKKRKDGQQYRLTLTKSKLTGDLVPFVFCDNRIKDIEQVIRSIDVGPEFNTMGHGNGNAVFPGFTLNATMESKDLTSV
ncbi:hypothetical protein LP415_09110 [Polaromonas sp. P1(28)-8]|nr:hypothetical protein LP415_09110 [Polaromonas sp. P1(28)-8]